MIISMIDYLSFGVDVESYQVKIDRLIPMLQGQKELAKINATNKVADKTTVDLGGVMFEVLPNGVNGYAFILNNDEYQIKLAQYRSTKEDYFPIFITIHSQCLWAYSPADAYINICKWITVLFGCITSNKVSRVDLCCHTDLLSSDTMDINQFKGIFKNCNVRNTYRKISGIEFGCRTSKIYCRIYDKVLEVKTKRNKLWFFDIWKNNGLITSEVWNVEFELKRDFFKSYNIDTVEDVFCSLKSIWDYCTKEWLVKIERDRTRTENCTVSPEWIAISNAFDEYISKPLIKREEQLKADAEALLPATIGYITTISARYGVEEIENALMIIRQSGDKYLNHKNISFESAINEKMDLLTTKKRGEIECKS